MAAPGNPNHPGGPFDLPKFFNPTPPNPSSGNLSPSPSVYPTSPSPSPSASASYPPLSGPYSYPPQTTQFHHPQFQLPPFSQQQDHPPTSLHHQRSLPYPAPSLPPSNHHIPPQNPNAGARLMALLSAPATTLEVPHQMPIQPSSGSSEFPVNPGVPIVHFATPLPNTNLMAAPMRMSSTKLPRGRHLIGDHATYNIDMRLEGEVQPQLEVTPITKYASDPGLVLGRQIAVNKSYICYGLKMGAIRVLNINTALRSLLKGLAQRVTDMAFFAEDVHLLASASVDGRIYVWKISEGPDAEEKAQITANSVVAIQIVGEGESLHPRVCWHCHKQEILVVGIGNCVLKIDTTKVGKGEVYSPDEPLKCTGDNLISGVQLVGKHAGAVTDLSMCQWMTSRLVSASTDGTIKIWDDRNAQPLAVLRPHEGRPVNSVAFMTAPERPDHIILVTAGPLNREVKIWVSAGEEGWLLPSDTELWHCTQTLELKSAADSRPEDVFFNQISSLSQAGLILLANAKKNAIYAIHLEYGPNPASTKMDYIAEFTVTMPILSFTGTSDLLPHGEHIVQVYCVQTQAIQQYALELSQCLPPLLDSMVLEKSDSGVIHHVSSTDRLSLEPSPLPLSPKLSEKLNVFQSPANDSDSIVLEGHGVHKHDIEHSFDRKMNTAHKNLSGVPSVDGEPRSGENNFVQDDISTNLNHPVTFKHPTHLVTPSEIFMATSASEPAIVNTDQKTEGEPPIQDMVNGNVHSVEVDVKVVGEIRFNDKHGIGSQDELHNLVQEKKDKAFCSQASDLGSDMARECHIMSSEIYIVEDNRKLDGAHGKPESAQFSNAGEQIQGGLKYSPDTNVVSGKSGIAQQPEPPLARGEKHMVKNIEGVGSSLPSSSTAISADFSSSRSMEGFFSQITSMQEMVKQLTAMQKEMQKQMNTMVTAPVTKEGKRLEAALGKNLEKSVKANTDALWARFQEENAKQEKIVRERTQQASSSVTNCITKDLPAMVEKTVKKELSVVGPALARTISPTIEKTVSAAVSEAFQRGVGDKAVNQLEKSVNSKLEATVARQIQTQFQTSGKQALQDSLMSTLEASVIPSFEKSCKTMFEQVDSTFQKGLVEHATAARKQFESAHSPLAMALRDAINSASSMTQTLNGEFAEGQRKLFALAAAGASSKAVNPLITQLSNGPLSGLQDKIEVPFDPTKELSRLLSERKYEEAFTMALQRNDVSIVSWLCSQVELQGLLSIVPLPLSQGVLLSLLHQLACDMTKDPTSKLAWMRDVALAINPTDPMIAMHVRPIFDQVYQILNHHSSLPTTSSVEVRNIRLVMHVINSMLMTSK